MERIMEEKIRWGILGTGRIAKTFAEALRGTEGCSCYAVASRTKDKADAFAKENGFEKAYGSYAELAADKNVDIVYIATPMSSHYGDSLLCLKNGRHVLCEKSLALNTAQSLEMIECAKKNGLFFMEAMWMKCRPSFLKIKEWIAEGKIGTPQYVRADFCSHIPYNSNDRLFRADCGGGALLDMSVYDLAFATSILGTKPEKIESTARLGREGVDLSNAIILKYKNGSSASLLASFELPSLNNAVVVGDKGSIVTDKWFFCCNEATLYDADGIVVEKCSLPVKVNGYEYEIMEANRCLREGLLESPMIPHADTIAIMQIMDECRKQWNMKFPEEK